ncbi:MAG: methyltransferase domain-containing protein [Gallionella sp.]|nr:methyltransferase domain-containing protein [Gallionella sp.]
MTEPLSFTGERFLPEREGEIWYEHWHRYALARQLSRHRTVLDVACGEGYGAAMLAENALRVTGVDISVDAIRHASNRYGHQANLEFIAASCDSLPFQDASFDLAISFETIEHIETQPAFIAELARVLRPDGVLLLSSPNKRLYSDAHDYHNEFHVRELYRDELEELLRAAFPHRSWLGQKLLFHSAIWPENGDVAATEYLVGDGGQVAVGHCPAVEPMYYIVACSRNPSMLSAALGRLSLFSDAAETVYRDYVRQTRRVLELDRLLIDRERLVAERDDLLVLRTGQMEKLDALLIARTEQIAERDALLALRTGQMEERERMIAERDALLVLRTGQMEERDEQLAQRAEQIAGLNHELDYRASLAWWIKSPWRIVKRIIKENP